MCRRPVLAQPNYNKPFVVHTDASAYGVGAILLQEGEIPPNVKTSKPLLHPIAYYSATFIQAERNYDIYERELLAVVKALKHWRHHLGGSRFPFTVVTDHANLAYWKEPRDLNRRTARWHGFLQDYWFDIQLTPGKRNTAADFLSRHPKADRGKTDNRQVTIFPPSKFVDSHFVIPLDIRGEVPMSHQVPPPLPRPSHLRVFDIDSIYGSLDEEVAALQREYRPLMKDWEKRYAITTISLLKPPQAEISGWRKEGKLVVPPNLTLKREIMRVVHEGLITGHPGRDETIAQTQRNYWWPDMRAWITEYVQGCVICQQNKIITHRTHPPMFKIPMDPAALPFQQIAMDLIIGLPESNRHNSILTIVDHGCSCAAVFLPCTKEISSPKIAQLYFDHVYRWFGLPKQIISDRDPRFTSHFGRALAAKLGVAQNLSTAFHPQTDGLSERKNQWIEQYLRLLTMAQQDDWDEWLTIASAVHNDRVNSTLGMTPNEALLGYRPSLYPRISVDTPNEAVESRLDLLNQKRAQATAAINKAAKTPHVIKEVFELGDQVWLDAKNLVLPYQSNKLAPRRQGPFRIKRIISPVAFQLELPASWWIHDVFHASLLTSFKETPAHGPNYSRPPPDLVDEDPEYEVEAIINHRFFGQRRRLQYLIKWKGYPHSDNTWEPVENLHADILVKAYHRKHPLEHKSRWKVRARTLSNWTPQSTPSTSLLLLSSCLLASITRPTGKKHPSKPPCPLALSTSLPSRPPLSRPPRFPPHLLEPPYPTPRRCPLTPSSQPSTLIPTSRLNSSDSSSTASPSQFKPTPLSMPRKSPASRTSSPISKKISAKSPSVGTHPQKATSATMTLSPASTFG